MATIQMKVSLLHVRPTIWRRIRVPSGISLADLHEVLQIAMGWTNSHLHQFVIDDEPLGEPGEFFDEASPEERKTKVDALIAKKRFGYDYDFGDGWEHDIEIEQVDGLDLNLVPTCVAGERSCPPEDCGGPGGYEEIVAILAKPKSRQYKELRADFPYLEPNAFRIEIVNTQLKTLVAKWQPRVAKKKSVRARTKPAND